MMIFSISDGAKLVLTIHPLNVYMFNDVVAKDCTPVCLQPSTFFAVH